MRLWLAIFMLVFASLVQQPMGGVTGHSGGCTSSISVVQAFTHNAYSCGSAPSCGFAYSSNVGSGHLLVVFADNNTGTMSITGSGTGCASTNWTSRGTVTGSFGLNQEGWTGNASGSGACTVTISVSPNENIGIVMAEFSGQTGIDQTATKNSPASTTLSFSSGGATSCTSELGIVGWASNGSITPAATGWNLIGSWYPFFDGAFTQTLGAPGTVTFSGTSFNGTANEDNDAIMITVK
jgi:hypothetical protein